MLRFAAFCKGETGATEAELVALAGELSPRFQVLRKEGERDSVPAVLLETTARREKGILERIARKEWAWGCASTRVAAFLAARCRSNRVIPRGGEEAFAAAFPLAWMWELSVFHVPLPDHLTTLARWGIRDFGELARLPQDELISRLGPEGLLLQKMASGQDPFPFQPEIPAAPFEEEQELAWSVDSLEALSFILDKLFSSLCLRLQERGLATDTVRLSFRLEDQSLYERKLQTALPLQDAKTLLSLVRLDLQSDPPASGVQHVRVRVDPTRPRIFQYSLFQAPVPSPERLARTLSRLQKLVGSDQVGRPVLLDTHRPDACRILPFHIDYPEQRRRKTPARAPDLSLPALSGPRLSLRRIRPPRPIQLQSRQVILCAGPWKTSGGWWGEASWSRDEWDIELADGGLYRVYWDRQEKGWFIEGIYD